MVFAARAVCQGDRYQATRALHDLIYCPVGPEYTVAHAVADFVEWKRVFGARQSWLSSISMANKYILPTLGPKPVKELNSQDLRDFIRLVESTPTGARNPSRLDPIDPETMDPEIRRKRRVSANNNYTLLRSALNMAWQEGKVEDDRPWRRVDRYRGVNRARPEMLTWEQCRNLIEAAEAELQRVILAALYTGCRITELMTILAEDLHRGRLALYIRPCKVYRARHIALPQEGYTFFEDLAYGKGPRAILLKRDNGALWNQSTCISKLKQAVVRARLPKKIIFHTFRHTYASLLLQAGTSPVVVARQLGHANMKTVLETYAHCTDDFIDRELRERYHPNFLALLKAPGSTAGNDNVRLPCPAESSWRSVRLGG